MNVNNEIILKDEDATVAIGKLFGKFVPSNTTIYLLGDLGAGKTTFTRGVLRAKGWQGVVKSPTYTLVEPYEIGNQKVYHFDLYRLQDSEELELMGIRDYFSDNSIRLVEWPSNGEGILPSADIELLLKYQENSRVLQIKCINETCQSWLIEFFASL